MFYIKAGLCLKQVKCIFNLATFQLISFLCYKKQEKTPVIFWGPNFALVLHCFQSYPKQVEREKERMRRYNHFNSINNHWKLFLSYLSKVKPFT